MSSPEDLEDMYVRRAEFDAILIGAGTVRKDNPSLLFKRPALEERRRQRGLESELTKVTITSEGNLDPQSKFFRSGEIRKIVICPEQAERLVRERLGQVADVVSLASVSPISVISALDNLGIRRLFVEGGTSVLTEFISAGVFHKLRVAIAPFFVGDDKAPRFVGNGRFVHDKKNRLRLVQVRSLGDMTVMDFENDFRLHY